MTENSGTDMISTQHIKYPKTNHLPWSLAVSSDDRVLHDLSNFYGKRVIVTKKMDGENCSAYKDHIHARSLDSRGGVDRDWVKQFWSTICADIPVGWRICGENLWAVHSIEYTDLPSYFLGFSMWDENNMRLSWDDTLSYFSLLGITPVPVIYDGIWDENEIRKLEKSLDFEKDEGYVVSLAEKFSYNDFYKSVAKFVRKNHVQTDSHWRSTNTFKQNGLKI